MLWSHDGTTNAPNFEPTSSIQLAMTNGLYSVGLGDTFVPNMLRPLNAAIFNNTDVRLRVWFNDGTNGFQQLIPDQRVGVVGYSFNSQKADTAAAYTGPVTLTQLPSNLVTNNATNVTFTGTFTGDGSGLIGLRGSAPWQLATPGVTNDAFPNTSYLVTSPAETVIRLPETASLRVGDVIRISGANPGSWKIAQRDGQAIYSANFTGGIAATWTPHQFVTNWNAAASSRDGMTMIAGIYNKGQIYQSTNGGANWSALPNSPVKSWRCLASSGDGSRIVGGTEADTLYMSTDSGQNWAPRAAPAGNLTWTGIASSADGTNLVAIPFNAPLRISNDGGLNWPTPPGTGSRPWRSCAISANGSSMFAAAAGDRILLSKDRGASWIPSNSDQKNWFALASSDEGFRVAAAVLGGLIYTSPDGGTNWIARNSSGTHDWVGLISSSDGSKLAAISDQIYTSFDFGATWTAHETNRVWTAIAGSADLTRMVTTVFPGRIYTSEATQTKFTTPGTTGYLVGGEYSAVELQHLGIGRFMPLSSSGSIIAY